MTRLTLESAETVGQWQFRDRTLASGLGQPVLHFATQDFPVGVLGE
jgi:hypothetical protein